MVGSAASSPCAEDSGRLHTSQHKRPELKRAPSRAEVFNEPEEKSPGCAPNHRFRGTTLGWGGASQKHCCGRPFATTKRETRVTPGIDYVHPRSEQSPMNGKLHREGKQSPFYRLLVCRVGPGRQRLPERRNDVSRGR